MRFNFDDIDLIKPLCAADENISTEVLNALSEPTKIESVVKSLDSLEEIKINGFDNCKLDTVLIYQVARDDKSSVSSEDVKVTLTTIT